MSSIIPIRNLYHMLCYAWDCLNQSDLIDLDADETDQPVDLLASVLVAGVNHLLRRGITQGYLSHGEELMALRGRADFAYSERRMLTRQGRVLCQFDELSVDILCNQILKASLYRLFKTKGLSRALHHKVGLTLKKFHLVSDIRLDRQVFKRVQISANHRFYRFILNVCELIFHECIPDDTAGDYRFRDFFRDEGKMAHLYEKFLFNFYEKNLHRVKVTSERIQWNATSEDDPELALLPTMLTDISLRSPERTLVIDAKYYRNTLTSFHGAKRIYSGNLYQVNAYLDNIAPNGGPDAIADGMLLYPVVNESVSVGYNFLGKNIRIETIDLNASWDDLEKNLLHIAGDFYPSQQIANIA